MSREIIIERGQTLYDIAVMHYGDMEGLFLIMEDNGITSVNHQLQVGDKLKIKSAPINQSVVDYFNKNEIVVNGGFNSPIITITRAFSSGFNLGFS